MNKKLAKELRAIGAPDHEIEALDRTAQKVQSVHVPGLSRAARQRIASRLPIEVSGHEPKHRISLRLMLASVGSFAVIGFAVLGFAQGSLPGSPLYEVKRNTEKARELVQPAYNDDLLDKRAGEIKELRQQETVDEQALQKAQDEFQRSYEKYEQRHSGDKNWQNPWQDYQQQWWWQPQGSTRSAPLEQPRGNMLPTPNWR